MADAQIEQLRNTLLEEEVGKNVQVDIDCISILLEISVISRSAFDIYRFACGLMHLIPAETGMFIGGSIEGSSDGDIFSIKKDNKTVPEHLRKNQVILFNSPWKVAIPRDEADQFAKQLEIANIPHRVVKKTCTSKMFLSPESNFKINWGQVVKAVVGGGISSIHIARWGQKWPFCEKGIRTAENFCRKLEGCQGLMTNKFKVSVTKIRHWNLGKERKEGGVSTTPNGGCHHI